MGMELCQYQTHAQVCELCGQEVSGEAAASERAQVVLFGAVPYAACPACKRITVERMKSILWRKKVDRYVHHHFSLTAEKTVVHTGRRRNPHDDA